MILNSDLFVLVQCINDVSILILLNDNVFRMVSKIIMFFSDLSVYLWFIFFLFISVVIGILKIDISDVIVVKNINKKNKLVIIDVFIYLIEFCNVRKILGR